MRPFIRSPPVLYCPRATSTTSVTLGTDTRPSSTALPTRLLGDNCLGNRTSRRRQRTSASDSRRTTTGSTGTHPRRTVWAAGAAAIPILLMWKARRAAVWPNGSTSPAGGPALRRGDFHQPEPGSQPYGTREKREVVYTKHQHRAWLARSRREWTRTRDRSWHDL